MAARKFKRGVWSPRGRPPFHPDEVRAKIQAIKLVDRLQDHIFGKIELTMAQVSGINVLLRKVLPDLTSTAVTADINIRYVAELPKVLTREEWLKKYGTNHLDLTATSAREDGRLRPDVPPAITDGNGKLQ